MIKLKSNGVFVLEDDKNKKELKKVFESDMYKKGNQYYIKGTEKNFIKLTKNFENILDFSCYLFPLVVKLKKKKLNPKTKNHYFYLNKKFLEFSKKLPEDVDMEDIRKYIKKLREEGKQISTLNANINALKFFYGDFLGGKMFNSLFIRKRKDIPKIFSRKEIFNLINSIKNQKHKLLIKLAYGCGLKLNELRRIKVTDINLGKKEIYIRDKNSKVIRSVPIPDSIVNDIKSYITSYYRDRDGYSDYLFFSESKRNKTGKITERAVEDIFRKSIIKAGIKGKFSFNTLRDSFAVHLLEKKYPVNKIIKILGVKKSYFYNRYGFFIKAVQNHKFPDLFDFSDLEINQ